MKMKTFQRISDPNMFGYVATRPDGLKIEVCRCYYGDWAIFTWANGEMSDHCRQGCWANDTRPQLQKLSFRQAMLYAMRFYTGANEIV